MDAIMAVLAATLLANADGRYGRLLAALVDASPNRRLVVAIFFATFACHAILSAVGAYVASQMLGLGVLNLFAAMALASAAGAVLWRHRSNADAANPMSGPLFGTMIGAPPFHLFVRLALFQLGDRNQFIIFALGALSGSALWGIIGGGAGLLVAMLPILAMGPALPEKPGARWLRWTAAAILLLWAVVHARAAFGV